MQKLDLHLFICTNTKEKGDFCAAKGGKELRDKLKQFVKANPQFKEKVKVTASGCLGFCEKGVSAIAYPQNHWFFELKPQDYDRLTQYISEQVK